MNAEVRVIERVPRNRHQCRLPGWWERRKLNLDFGSVVECPCGRRWQWSMNYATTLWVHWPDPLNTSTEDAE